MTFAINVDVFLNSIMFLVEVDKLEFERWYYDNTKMITNEEHDQMLNDILDSNSCMGFTIKTDNGSYVVYLREAYKDMYVVHEIYHAINKMLMSACVHHDMDDEPFAYTLGYVVNEYYNRVDEFKSKKSQC
jgi:hypothetical protein